MNQIWCMLSAKTLYEVECVECREDKLYCFLCVFLLGIWGIRGKEGRGYDGYDAHRQTMLWCSTILYIYTSDVADSLTQYQDA